MSRDLRLSASGEADVGGVKGWLQRARTFPFVLLYAWLWKEHRSLLTRTFVYSYLAPVLLELVPCASLHPFR